MADKQLGSTESVHGVTEQELGWSAWWIEHRDGVRKLAVALFAAFDAVLLLIGLWGFTDWLAFGGIKEAQGLLQMTSAGYGQVQGLTLQEVKIGAPIVLQGATGKIDILIPVENDNPNFWAELRYHVNVGGAAQRTRTAFVLPGQSKYLAELGASSDAGSGVEMVVESRAWHRAVTSGGLTAQQYADTRLNIHADNAAYVPSDPQATSPVSSATFTLNNDTAFGYYDVSLLVLLERGDAIVGADVVPVDRLLPEEQKPMQVYWYQSLPQVTKVEVVPDINIYDPSVYRAPGA